MRELDRTPRALGQPSLQATPPPPSSTLHPRTPSIRSVAGGTPRNQASAWSQGPQPMTTGGDFGSGRGRGGSSEPPGMGHAHSLGSAVSWPGKPAGSSAPVAIDSEPGTRREASAPRHRSTPVDPCRPPALAAGRVGLAPDASDACAPLAGMQRGTGPSALTSRLARPDDGPRSRPRWQPELLEQQDQAQGSIGPRSRASGSAATDSDTEEGLEVGFRSRSGDHLGGRRDGCGGNGEGAAARVTWCTKRAVFEGKAPKGDRA